MKALETCIHLIVIVSLKTVKGALQGELQSSVTLAGHRVPWCS